MKSNKRIYFLINNLTLIASLFFAIYIALFTDEMAYSVLFGVLFVILALNRIAIVKAKNELFISVFIVVTNLMILTFQSGISSPIRTDYYYIPMFLASMVVSRGMNRWVGVWSIGVSSITFLAVCFSDLTPKLELVIYNPQHYTLLSYINSIFAVLFAMAIVYTMFNTASRYSEQLGVAMQKNEAHRLLLNSITDNIDTGICRTNASLDKVIYVNHAQLKLFGYTEAEFRNLNPFTTYADPASRKEIINELNQKGYINNKEVLYRRKDGTTFWGLLSSRKVIAADGSVMYDGAIRDITELKKVKEELQQSKTEAEKASLAKSKFVSAMSHEIRTPMNAVIGITNVMLMDKNRSAQDQEHLNMLNSAANNLLKLLNDALDFSKIEAGKIELDEKPVNLSIIANELRNLYATPCQEKQISFEISADEKLPIVIMDSVKLTQVMINLLSNAVRHTRQGGIKCQIKLMNETAIDAEVEFSVTDTGSGISPSKLNSIFNAFEQVHTTDVSVGAGLGLAISRRIIERMNSRIQVESEEGKGSRFYFTLKLAKVSGIVKDKQGIQPASVNGRNILLVEDNTINVFVTRQLLERWGAQVTVAENGLQAIEMISHQPFDIILLDLHMPGMNGFETARALRSKGVIIPIIALTADALAETKDACISAGMNDYITKPFNPKDLQNKIAAHAPRTHA